MRALLAPALAMGLASACSRSTPPVPDPQGSIAPSASAAPAGSKEGPPPSDPALANVNQPPPIPMPPASETKPLATGSNAFAVDLWSRVSKTPGNLTFSPASISLAVAMAWGGAKGDTAAQMKKTMHFAGEPDATVAGWGKLSRALSSPGRPRELRIANRLFGESTYKFDQTYLDKTASAFGAPLEPLDFKTGFEPARAHINEWVEQQTKSRITGLLPAGALDTMTRLVLVNAIYFLAEWLDPFEGRSTSDEPFIVSASSKPNVPMMHRTASYPYAQVDGVKVLAMPYLGNDVAMFAVLPDKQDGLAAVESSLTTAKIAEWTKSRPSSLVEVTFPRFELSPPALSLGDELAALGMPLAFTKGKADFTGIANPADKDERLSISKVVHKAFVKVNEKGTEAAAATALVMAAGAGMPQKTIEFNADHPFLFFIVDKTSGLVLFMGRVADPSAK
jgi:serpin B